MQYSIYPSKNEISKLNTGNQQHVFLPNWDRPKDAVAGDVILVKEPYYKTDAGVIYKYSKEAEDSSLIDNFLLSSAIFMKDADVRYSYLIDEVISSAYSELTDEFAHLIGFKTAQELKVMFIKKLPKHLRRELGPKANPILRIAKVSKISVDKAQ